MSTSISRVMIHSNPAKVWDALTNPELVKQWQYGSLLISDWQVGSEIRFRNEWEGQVFEQWGKVLEVVPNKLIKYTLFAPRPGVEDKPENYFVMSYILTEDGGNTLLSIEQNDTRPGSDSEVQESQDDDSGSVLSVLKHMVEAS
ncbi:ATPase [Paenibacillus sp. HJL G12]|uniref:ATPase n=1 Tax=Paenibacillus dendrobii TaxID=2691084 RepID=A0A7X3IFN4_9BACL|nr:SRPBCC family protein [Paenibacillus dendrobii]MWV43034.1 ATPase [Paenibacillus dendrobii]